MFELPQGEPVDETADLSVGAMQMPFDCGVISHYSGRRKTPIGHRLVCDGLVVGWLTEGEERNVYVAGEPARAKLLQVANSAKIRSTASMWRRNDLANIIAKLPEAFPDTAQLGALMPGSADIYTLDPADVARHEMGLHQSSTSAGKASCQQRGTTSSVVRGRGVPSGGARQRTPSAQAGRGTRAYGFM